MIFGSYFHWLANAAENCKIAECFILSDFRKNGKSSKKAKYLICQACVKSFRLKGNDRSKFCSRNIRIVQKVHMHGVYYLWFFQKITHILPCLLHYIISRNINSNSSDIRIRSSFRVITEDAETIIYVKLRQINTFPCTQTCFPWKAKTGCWRTNFLST